MNAPGGQGGRFEARLRSSTIRLAIWTGIWLLTTALLAFGPELLWNETPALTWAAVALNLLVGLGVVIANKHHLRDLDDLHRKVMFDAMGITLAVALIVSVPWSIIDVGAEFEHLLIVMSISFIGSVCLGLRRYQ